MHSAQATVKRPVAVTGVTLLQFLLGFLWLGITLYLLLSSWSAGMKQRPDAAAAILGLEIAAAVVAPGAVFGLTAAYALHKNKVWGWWLSLLINAAFVVMLTYSMIDEGWDSLDPEMVGFALLSLMPATLLFLPAVRQFYWRKPSTVK
jgi:ABC-type sulfate transport system permease subunit